MRVHGTDPISAASVATRTFSLDIAVWSMDRSGTGVDNVGQGKTCGGRVEAAVRDTRMDE
jgi:hypothetical protein